MIALVPSARNDSLHAFHHYQIIHSLRHFHFAFARIAEFCRGTRARACVCRLQIAVNSVAKPWVTVPKAHIGINIFNEKQFLTPPPPASEKEQRPAARRFYCPPSFYLSPNRHVSSHGYLSFLSVQLAAFLSLHLELLCCFVLSLSLLLVSFSLVLCWFKVGPVLSFAFLSLFSTANELINRPLVHTF